MNSSPFCQNKYTEYFFYLAPDALSMTALALRYTGWLNTCRK